MADGFRGDRRARGAAGMTWRAQGARGTDEGQANLVKAFESASGKDKGRCLLARDLSLKSVDDL